MDQLEKNLDSSGDRGLHDKYVIQNKFFYLKFLCKWRKNDCVTSWV